MILFGTITYVEERSAGTQLVGAHSSGVTVLNVADVGGMPEAGSVLVGTDTLAYLSIADTSDEVATTDTIVLAAATVNAYTDKQQVTVTPAREYKIALVTLPDLTTVEVRIPHHFHAMLAEGPREDGAGEVVELRKQSPSYLVITDVYERPAPLLSYADPNDPITPGAVTTSWDNKADEWASRAHPEILGTGNVNGSLFIKGTLRSGGGGSGGVDYDATGLHTYRSTGEPRSGFLNDDDQPDILRGVVDGTKGNFTEGVYLDGTNILGQGASLQLHSSIDPPHLEPTVFTDWPCVDVAFPDPLVEGIQPSDRFGFALKSSTEAYSLTSTVTLGLGVLNTVTVFNPSSGAYVGDFTFPVVHGLAPGTPVSVSYSSINDRIVTLERARGTVWEYRARSWQYTGTALVFDSEWTPSALDASTITANRPSIAVKNILGTEYVVIAQSQTDGTIKIRNYVAHSLVETMTTPVAMNMGNLQGMAHLGGTIALAGNVTYLNSDGAPALPVFDVSGFFAPKGTYLGALQVGNGDPLAAGIATWDADTEKARTWYLSRASNSVIQHSNVFEAGAYWAQAAWGDSATGHLTLPSSAVLVQKIPGSRVTIGLGELPTGVDSAMLYFGAGSSYPGVAGMWSQNTLTAGSAYVKVFTVQNASPYVNPLTVATLTGGTPAKIVNAAGVTLLDANSTARLVAANNLSDVASLATTQANLGMVPGSWTAVTYQNSWATQVEAAQYRSESIGNVVRIRGRIKSGATATVAFTLPSGSRPAVRADFPLATDVSGVSGAAQVATGGAVTITLPTGATWVSLSSIIFSTT